jgi:hypothetical protein
MTVARRTQPVTRGRHLFVQQPLRAHAAGPRPSGTPDAALLPARGTGQCVIDSHLHVVDFLQRSLRADELTETLTTGEVDQAVVFGLPVKKKWATSEPQQPTYYLDDNAPCSGYSLTDELVASLVLDLPRELQARVAPLICGLDPTDLLAAEHVELVAGRHDGLWRGVGELFLRHDDLTELTYGENARADHPALDDVLDICAARDWSVLVHQDASSAGRACEREYVDELVAMLDRHPAVPVVWAHAGVSRRVRPGDHAHLLDDLLTAHPQLHVDLSWEVTELAVREGEPHPDWLRLVERHPDRFVLGSDAFGDLSGYADRLRSWNRFAARLSPTTGDLVRAGNALRIWFS